MLAELKPAAAAPQDVRAGARITKVEIIAVHVPFAIEFKIATGGIRPGVDVILVRLHTDAGVTGIGETPAWRRQGSNDTVASLTTLIRDHFTPLVVGRSPFDIGAILADMDTAIWHSNYAQAAIADALLDLQGKLLGVPVYQLLGGKCRDGVGACAVIGIKADFRRMLDDAQGFYDKGFRSFTIKIGNDAVKDVKAVEAIRAHLPDDALMRVDANAGMDFDTAVSVLKRLEPLQIDAAEQMVPPWDVAGMAELARRTPIPLMADECIATDHDLLDVIQRRAATVMQTKSSKNGGIWRCRELWTIARAAGMRIYPGNHPGTSIVATAVAHLATAWPGPLLEGPFAVGICGLIGADVVTEPAVMDGRFLRVSDRPGFGLELDDDRIEALRIPF